MRVTSQIKDNIKKWGLEISPACYFEHLLFPRENKHTMNDTFITMDDLDKVKEVHKNTR